MVDKYEDVIGWCPQDKIEKLEEIVSCFKNPVIVESGVYGGKSIIPMAVVCKKRGRGHCYGIDPWDKVASVEGYPLEDTNAVWWSKLDYSYVYREWRNALRRYDVEKFVTELKGKSDEFVKNFAEGSINIFHLDSNHSELVSCREVEQWHPKIKMGGYFVFDDTDWNTTLKAQTMLIRLGYRLVDDRQKWAVFIKDEVSTVSVENLFITGTDD